MDLAQALHGSTAPPGVLARLCLLDVPHLGFDGAERVGQLVVDAALAGELRAIFERVLGIGFPIERIMPISAYGWDDDASMADNNSSCFNYRLIAGTDVMSVHSEGRAVDINPRLNPYGATAATWLPPGSRYDLGAAGTIGPEARHPAGREILRVFADAGWTWLGDDAIHDRHHFQKPA